MQANGLRLSTVVIFAAYPLKSLVRRGVSRGCVIAVRFEKDLHLEGLRGAPPPVLTRRFFLPFSLLVRHRYRHWPLLAADASAHPCRSGTKWKKVQWRSANFQRPFSRRKRSS